MRPISRLLIILTLAALLASCSGLASSIGGAGQSVRSNKPREAAPQTTDDDRAELAAGNAAFAVDLYRQLATENARNLFYSPYSISLALAMTYAGAQGETQQQMAEVLHFTLPPERLHPAFNALEQDIAARAKKGGRDGEAFQLRVVNDLWGQKDHTFLPEFLDVIAQNYGTGLRLMDFTSNPNRARQQINDYIARQTDRRVENLLPDGAVTSDTRLILTNAIYFNALWAYEFDAYLTSPSAFTLLDGTSVDVDMMSQSDELALRYTAGKGYQAVALPYKNRDLSMLLIVPDAGQFANFEAALDAEQLAAITRTLVWKEVYLSMPKFTFLSAFSLKDSLSALGMAPAFTDEADFSGITGERELFIDNVVHKSFVRVDEAGTEAAAASAVGMKVGAAPMEEQPIVLVVDRPFIFLIRDESTDTILFMGRVLDPR